MRQLMKADDQTHQAADFTFGTELPEGKKANASSLVIPILLLVGIAFGIIYLTGNGNMLQGDITIAMFASGIITLLASGIWYMFRGLVSMDKYINWCLEGMHEMFEVILIFVLAYATGSSSATVALLFPIFVPMAYKLGIPLSWTVGAVISGAIFGDQNSPISDSVILTSKISGVNIISHVRTQIPYTGLALLMAFIGFSLLYLICY